MELFKKREETATEVIYSGNRYYIEDEGEEMRKFCYTKVVLRTLMDKYPNKKKELKKLYDYINNLVQDAWRDAENLIKLESMDMILYRLDRILMS